MPEIAVKFDTAAKTCAAYIDGLAVSDLSEFHMYETGGGRYQMELCSRVEDRQAGTYKVTRVMAAKDGALEKTEEAGRIEAAVEETVKAIAKLMSPRKDRK